MISLLLHVYANAEAYAVICAAGTILSGYSFAYLFLTRHCDLNRVNKKGN